MEVEAYFSLNFELIEVYYIEIISDLFDCGMRRYVILSKYIVSLVEEELVFEMVEVVGQILVHELEVVDNIVGFLLLAGFVIINVHPLLVDDMMLVEEV